MKNLKTSQILHYFVLLGTQGVSFFAHTFTHKNSHTNNSVNIHQRMATYYQLFIINRSGGLVYTKSLSSTAPNLSTNDCLRLGSTFHGLHAIATQIAPVVSMGIERLETDNFTLQCFQTLTGVKFVITAAPGTPDLDGLLRSIYEVYSDYVLKVLLTNWSQLSHEIFFKYLFCIFVNCRIRFTKLICPFAANFFTGTSRNFLSAVVQL